MSSNRQTVDRDADSSSGDDDLSLSFEQILEMRRAARQKPTVVSSTTPSNNNATYSADYSISTGLGEMQLCDVTEPSMFERLSPCKRVGLLRPSTVLENSDEDRTPASSATSSANTSSATGGAVHSFQTAAEPVETSCATARSTQSTSAASVDDSNAEYTRDSLAFVSAGAERSRESYIEEDSLDNAPSPIQPIDRPFDDTLEVVEYDRSSSKYLLKPVTKTSQPVTPQPHRLSAQRSQREPSKSAVIVLDSDSSPETSFHTARSNVKKEEQSFRSITDTSVSMALYPKSSDDRNVEQPADISEVISLVSSDSDSNNDCNAVAEERETSHTENNKSVDVVNNCTSNGIIEKSSLNHSSNNVSEEDYTDENKENSELYDSLSLDTAAMPDEFNDTIERMDYMMELGRRIQEKQQRSASKLAAATPTNRTNSPLRTATSVPMSRGADSAAVVATSAASNRLEPPYHLKTSRNSPRLAAAATTPAKLLAPAAKKLFRTPVSNNSPVLKVKIAGGSTNNSPMPSGCNDGVFKKPTAGLTLTGPRKGAAMQTPATSRIPKPKSAGRTPSSSAYDYVRSPIGAYISQRAPNPMVQNCKFDKDILESTFCTNAPNELDYTLPAINANAENGPPRSRLTKKAYMPSERKEVCSFWESEITSNLCLEHISSFHPFRSSISAIK